MGEARYPNLFRPLRIGALTLENRIVMAAFAAVFSEGAALTDRREVYFLRERARGGVGLIVAGNRLVHPSSQAPCRGYSYGFRKEMVKRDQVLTRVVHEQGVPIFAQLNHFGAHGNSMVADDYRPLLSPSPMKSPAWGETPKEMEPEDLEEAADAYALCAALTREGGFDGVELHMANGYLLHQFLSEIYNKRENGYGGDLEHRQRFPLEVISRVRERVGADFVVGVRLAAEEMVPGGMAAAAWADVAATLARTSQVDYIGLAGGTYHSYAYECPPPDIPEGWLLDSAATVKHAVGELPVLAGGALRTPELAERALAEGSADAVLLGRALLADPEWPAKAREGREEEIVRCIRCNQGCIARLYKAAPVACTVNPAAGREEKLGADTLVPARQPGRWLVVGGGPAGMHAAAVLAQRGNDVTLLERRSGLGGLVNVLLLTPRRESFRALVEDLAGELARLGVDVRLGTEATAELVQGFGADGVVLATGSTPLRTGFSTAAPFVPRLPGVEQENVLTAVEALEQPDEVGASVLLLDDDGTRYAAGTAEALLDHGKQVHVVTRFQSLGPRIAESLDQGLVYAFLFGKGLRFTPNHWVRRIEGDSAVLFNLYSAEETRIDGIDTFVLAIGHHANDDLYLALKGRVANLCRIGDCLAPRMLDHALYEAELAGRELLTSAERHLPTGDLWGWEPEALAKLAAAP